MNNTDTKTTILDCAEDLIQRVGVNAMSYNDISKLVGITKASIHHHFPTKNDLIVSLLTRCSISYGKTYQAVAASKKNAIQKLNDLAAIFEQGLRNNKVCLIGMLSTEQGTLNQEIKQSLEISIQKTTAIYQQIIIQAKNEKTISSKTESKKAAYAYLSFLLGAQILSRCSGDITAFTETVNEYLNTLKR